MTNNMLEVTGVKVERVAITELQATFSVIIDGCEVGNVSCGKYYEPVLRAIGSHVAFWAGPTLCVIDRHQQSIDCIDRDDETHRVHPFEDLWIVEGELNVDLFDPKSATTLATYHHNEVITSSSLAEGLVHIRDFAGATVTLDPNRSLQVVPSRTPAGGDR